MSIADSKARYAGFNAIGRGVNTAVAPVAVPPDQLVWMINGTSRGRYPQCRPGWKQQTLTFLDENGAVDTTVRDNFEDKKWQGAHPYTTQNGAAHIIASIGGRIFRVDVDSFNVQDLSTITGLSNPDKCPRTWMVQAEEFLVIQDGSSLPLIYNGATMRRSKPKLIGGNEIPAGMAMEYNKGRIWVALPDGQSFVAGDLAYSVTGTTKDVLTFTENTFLNGGGSFSIPAHAGPIRAIRSLAVQDSTTGNGPLQVFTTKGVVSINAPFVREEWQNTVNPIQSISSLSSGAESQDSTVTVNGDIWFRSLDGVRSFVIARRDHGSWVNTPMSAEMDRIMTREDLNLLRYGSAAVFDNRLLVTVSPYRHIDTSNVEHGIAHQGLAVLDFHPVSGMFERSQPVWDGIWTGLRILQVIYHPAVDRLFMFTVSTSDHDIELWELTRTDRFDSLDNQISWVLETPSYGFVDQGWNLKRLRTASIWHDRVAGDVDFTAKWCPDDEPLWRSWHTWSECAKYQDCDKDECDVPSFYHEQYRPRTRLPAPPETADSITSKPYDRGYTFALRLEMSGFCRIKRLRLEAQDEPEEFSGDAP